MTYFDLQTNKGWSQDLERR